MTNHPTPIKKTSATSVSFPVLVLMGAVASLGLLFVMFQCDANPRFNYGYFSPYCTSILAIIYAWKIIILRSCLPNFQKRNSFLLLMGLALPFVFWKCAVTPTVEAYSLAHILGSPIWILLIPIASFFLFEFTSGPQSIEKHLPRLFVETVILFPIWTAIVAVTLVATGLTADWTNMFFRC